MSHPVLCFKMSSGMEGKGSERLNWCLILLAHAGVSFTWQPKAEREIMAIDNNIYCCSKKLFCVWPSGFHDAFTFPVDFPRVQFYIFQKKWFLPVKYLEWNVTVNKRFTLEFFINSPKYKNANITNFILALPFRNNKTTENWNCEI